jgi:hypothetical protein
MGPSLSPAHPSPHPPTAPAAAPAEASAPAAPTEVAAAPAAAAAPATDGAAAPTTADGAPPLKVKKKRDNNPGVRVQGGRIYDSEKGTTCHQVSQARSQWVEEGLVWARGWVAGVLFYSRSIFSGCPHLASLGRGAGDALKAGRTPRHPVHPPEHGAWASLST